MATELPIYILEAETLPRPSPYGQNTLGVTMLISEAQADVRQGFARGAAGQFVSGMLWLVAAALGTWSSRRAAMITLVVGGFFIFPATSLLLRMLGRSGALRPGSPFTGLAMQVAFVVPLAIPVALWAAQANPALFFPAMTIIVGAHFLPFGFLYGMREFLGLALVLLGIGYWFGWARIGAFAVAGWWTAGALLLFAAWQGLRLRGAST